MNNEVEKHYNLLQSAELLGIKVRTVREWVRTGKLKAMKYSGSRMWFVPESEIRRVQNVYKR